jgi:hypothetical protein
MSYNVRQPDEFYITEPFIKFYSLRESNYTGNISDNYMSGGKGKLTDGKYGGDLLPNRDVNASGSNWLAWWIGILHPKARPLDVYFKFDGDKLFESSSVNVLNQQFVHDYVHVAAYVYSKVIVKLLKEDNSTVVRRRVHTTSPRETGIYTIPVPIRSCKPARIVRMTFRLQPIGLFLFLGEIQFEGEAAIQVEFDRAERVYDIDPGRRLVLSCLSNKPNIAMYHNGNELYCDAKPISNNRYNCTITKERFHFKDAGKYRCFATSFSGKCQSRSKAVDITYQPGA